MLRRSMPGYGLITSIVLIIAGVALSACQTSAGPASVRDVTSQETGTPASVQTVSPTPDAPQTARPEAATAGSANVDVSPNEVTLGKIVLTFSVQPAQSVYDPARVAYNPDGSDNQKANAHVNSYAVLGGSSLKVTNNLDPSQTPPADQPREILRHVALQIKEKETRMIIPHINVSLDLLLVGRPALQDQPLVPMVKTGGGIAQVQYGNNVKFPGRGEYQVFVRIEPSPLLDASSTGVAQFNVSVK